MGRRPGRGLADLAHHLAPPGAPRLLPGAAPDLDPLLRLPVPTLPPGPARRSLLPGFPGSRRQRDDRPLRSLPGRDRLDPRPPDRIPAAPAEHAGPPVIDPRR